jgi:MoaA/NifB/PqqE/SkfB family radical SAM enzyme
LFSLKHHIKWLTIAGGEPFLHKSFEQVLQFVINECPSIRLLSIPSNGLDTDRIISYLSRVKNQNKLLLYVTFSIDGPPDIHDFVRGVEQGYARTWKTYMEAKKLLGGNKNIRIALETTISKYNANHVEPFIKKLISENHNLIVTVAHNAYQYKNEGQERLLFHESSDHVKAVVESVANHIRGFSPEKILKKIYLKNCVQYMEDSGKHILPCTALQNSIVVDPYGNVFPCTMWDKKLGNIREHDYNIMALWQADQRLQTRREITKAQCPGCWTPCEAYQTIAENFYRPSVFKNLW